MRIPVETATQPLAGATEAHFNIECEAQDSDPSTTLDLPGSTLSFHLKELMSASLVTQEREGRNLIWSDSMCCRLSRHARTPARPWSFMLLFTPPKKNGLRFLASR